MPNLLHNDKPIITGGQLISDRVNEMLYPFREKSNTHFLLFASSPNTYYSKILCYWGDISSLLDSNDMHAFILSYHTIV